MAERILIVDDEIDMLELLKRIIEDKTDYQFISPRILCRFPKSLKKI